MADLNKVGLLVQNGDSFMMCRKKGLKSGLTLPGGRLEPGETSLECLAREIHEELGDVQAKSLQYLGTYEDVAASDDPRIRKMLQIELYSGTLSGDPEPHSEISEIIWYSPDSNIDLLSPIMRNRIIPDLVSRGILSQDFSNTIKTNKIELLAPAKDAECGKAAIDFGADAVYIGGSKFGARENAVNQLENIAELVEYAHKYWARVYVTLNTLLRDDEIPQALDLINKLYGIKIDGLIIQDTGLLECDLPPIPLIASTQMHNNTPEKVAFLGDVGIKRAILARELDLQQIRAIREATHIELECFIHGALCVCYSGQCYMSYALGGRSGNRGQCAQPCRKAYDLVDAEGNRIAKNKHLLSLKDLNLSENLKELLEAGVTSFKIEGRLKERAYVSNIVAYYRAKLDSIISEMGLRRSSCGYSEIKFTPNPNKTFNRGFTKYYLNGRTDKVGSIDTPKMVGEYIGKVLEVKGKKVILDTKYLLHRGDGISFFNEKHELSGTLVNEVNGNSFVPDKIDGIFVDTLIYRNHDREFYNSIEKAHPVRRIPITMVVGDIPDGLMAEAVDEEGICACGFSICDLSLAQKPEQIEANIRKQMMKTGDTEFLCTDVAVKMSMPLFAPISILNNLRRDVLHELSLVRAVYRPVETGGPLVNDVPYPQKKLTFEGNVLNSKSEAFYRRHGVEEIERAAESGLNMKNRRIMHNRYCIKYELDLCPKTSNKKIKGPLYLVDSDGKKFRLEFDCNACEMEVWLE